MSQIQMQEISPEKIGTMIQAITDLFPYLSKEEVTEFFHQNRWLIDEEDQMIILEHLSEHFKGIAERNLEISQKIQQFCQNLESDNKKEEQQESQVIEQEENFEEKQIKFDEKLSKIIGKLNELEIIFKNQKSNFHDFTNHLTFIINILENIIKNPDTEDYRQIELKNNQFFMGKIIKEILQLIGFLEEEDVLFSQFYYYEPDVE